MPIASPSQTQRGQQVPDSFLLETAAKAAGDGSPLERADQIVSSVYRKLDEAKAALGVQNLHPVRVKENHVRALLARHDDA